MLWKDYAEQVIKPQSLCSMTLHRHWPTHVLISDKNTDYLPHRLILIVNFPISRHTVLNPLTLFMVRYLCLSTLFHSPDNPSDYTGALQPRKHVEAGVPTYRVGTVPVGVGTQVPHAGPPGHCSAGADRPTIKTRSRNSLQSKQDSRPSFSLGPYPSLPHLVSDNLAENRPRVAGWKMF